MERLLTPKQVANILQIHYNTVLDYLDQGKIKGFKLANNGKSRHWRIKESDFEAFCNGKNK